MNLKRQVWKNYFHFCPATWSVQKDYKDITILWYRKLTNAIERERERTLRSSSLLNKLYLSV